MTKEKESGKKKDTPEHDTARLREERKEAEKNIREAEDELKRKED